MTIDFAAEARRQQGGKAAPKRTPPMAPSQVVALWRNEGPLVRVRTGIPALDRLCRGGLPVPWRVTLVGAPSAGKTFAEVLMANTMALGDVCVGILAVDEEPEDITVRLAQMAGFALAETEQRAAETLGKMATALQRLRLRLYDYTWTIEAAAADLAAYRDAERCHGALFLDSLHAVPCEAAEGADSERARLTANTMAIRSAAANHRLLVVSTAEANRGSYRDENAAEQSNDLAAGAETRAIEYVSQTQLMLRTPKDHPDVIHARVAKNRRHDRGEFWLQLDRDGHQAHECGNPDENPAVVAEREAEQEAQRRRRVYHDAVKVAETLRENPGGLGTKKLRAALRAAGRSIGVSQLDAAMKLLEVGTDLGKVVDLGTPSCHRWVLEHE